MFAQRLKELRKKSNMTQVQLAERLDVSKGTIAMWETGKRQPNFETLNELSDIFDKTFSTGEYIFKYQISNRYIVSNAHFVFGT
jgi:transcriptional regulator with XRE-family HTH domain